MRQEMSAELKSFSELAEKFAQKEIEPDVLERDRYPFVPFNENAWQKAVEVGLATVTLPEAYGGAGQNISALSTILEKVARVDAGTSALLLCQSLAQAILVECASETASSKVFKEGKVPIIACPLYELPDDIQTLVWAKKEGDDFVLNGWAPYLAGAPIADAFIVPAKISENEVGLFVVEKGTNGVCVGEPAVSLGLRTLPCADVGCENVKVSADRKLQNKYEDIVDRYRAGVTSLALGLLIGSYQTALDYAQERYQAKKHIIEHDQVRMMFSRMVSLIEMGEAMVERACAVAESSRDPVELLSIQTRFTQEVAMCAEDGVQILGGYGYMHDYGQEKRMRDAKQVQAIFGPHAVKQMDILTRKLGKAV